MTDNHANGNGMNGNFRKAADSTAALAFARFAMPLLVALVGTTGSFILYDLVGQIKDIRESLKPMWSQIGETNAKLNSIQAGVAANSAKQDEITTTTKSILNDHEIRMRFLEHPH